MHFKSLVFTFLISISVSVTSMKKNQKVRLRNSATLKEIAAKAILKTTDDIDVLPVPEELKEYLQEVKVQRAKSLLECCCNDAEEALFMAARYETPNVIHVLIDLGAQINVQKKNNCGKTALMLAALNQRGETVKALLARGAQIDLKDHYGHTALGYAEQKGYQHIAQLLKENKNSSLIVGKS